MEASTDQATAEGELDQGFLHRIGLRIRQLRQEQGLTVQQLADRAEISRRLLTQIEHGQANPSLAAITRIAHQLGTDTTSLLSQPQEWHPVDVFAPEQHVLVWSSEAVSTAHLVSATSDARRADMWVWHLEPGDRYQGNADPAGSQELFHVVRGELTIECADDAFVVREGSAARLHSDRRYAYVNDSDGPVDFVRTVALGPGPHPPGRRL